MKLDRVLGQPRGAPTAGDLAADNGADDPVDVADGQDGHDLLLALDGGGAKLAQNGVIERRRETVVLRNLAITAHIIRNFRLVENIGEIQPARLPVVNGFLGFEQIGAANHLVQLLESELRH